MLNSLILDYLAYRVCVRKDLFPELIQVHMNITANKSLIKWNYIQKIIKGPAQLSMARW